jgi:hypothetical protein
MTPHSVRTIRKRREGAGSHCHYDCCSNGKMAQFMLSFRRRRFAAGMRCKIRAPSAVHVRSAECERRHMTPRRSDGEQPDGNGRDWRRHTLSLLPTTTRTTGWDPGLLELGVDPDHRIHRSVSKRSDDVRGSSLNSANTDFLRLHTTTKRPWETPDS